ncbi:hypothetical protein Patl1_19220 [Pistacia atlantica]|uniref:Uncharacterized protein n=1 Tax=Pistacia atlantica TaxID=434234 RepID=A0ACC1BXE4_9ROSI|nr:hypothetical protein Patl1_19220 [Pistacia atlantica]
MNFNLTFLFCPLILLLLIMASLVSLQSAPVSADMGLRKLGRVMPSPPPPPIPQRKKHHIPPEAPPF